MKRLLILLSLFTQIYCVDFQVTKTQTGTNLQKINVLFDLQEQEAILTNSITTSIDSPHIKAESINISGDITAKYLPSFKQTKSVYDNNFNVEVTLHNTTTQTVDGNLHISYLSTNQKHMTEKVVPLKFTNIATSNQPTNLSMKPMPKPSQPEVMHQQMSWTDKIQNLVEHTKTPWMRILFALLLGLLLSLTPCIYPMIPITIGILHSHGKKSVLHNFAGSLCYAFGLATTFSILGFLAATAGSTFGSLLSQPFFVVILVCFIGYMSLTMIGIFDMYTPSFMQGEVKFHSKLGPFFAAFLFGAITGTIASPCISPGLALLLSMVATMGNKILGLALLFAFGIGMSTPLIIIGTFSNSLHMLPRSGMWMVEIKKVLGFFMLATCFYYLANIVPANINAWLYVAFALFTAIFYLIDAQKSSGYSKMFKNLISISMIAITLLMATKAYEATFYKESVQTKVSVDWQKNYQEALKHAQENKNILLLDFWANHCTICKAIDTKVFKNTTVKNKLQDKVTFLKVDATDTQDPEYKMLKEKYSVHAQPAILIINPTNEKVIKRWSSEPYSMTIQEFIQAVQKTM